MRRLPFDSSYFTLLFLLLLLIISDQGASEQKNGAGVSRQRWLQYQTALSNTGPLGSPTDSSTSPVTLPTTTTFPISVNASTPSRSSPTPTNPPSSTTSTTTTKAPLLLTTVKNFARGNSASINTYNSNRNNYFGAGRRRIPTTFDGFPDGALFENNTSVNITVPLGDSAFLRCRVKNLGERSLSWIRRRDWHILTTGKITYTNDERFNVLHTEGTEDWTLQIKFVQRRDQGTYECQISTGTGIISFLVHLIVAVPEAFILGNGDEYHVEEHSTINLVCVIEKSPKVPEFIFWYHNERMINYGSSREVTVKTEPGLRTQSRLTIRDAVLNDSGNYSCSTPHAEPASIFVYVSQASGLFSGDKIAAIQRRTNSNSHSSSSSASASASPLSSRMAEIPQLLPITISAITITLQSRIQMMTLAIFRA